MTTIEGLTAQLSGLTRQDIEAWIANDWVRPDGHAGRYEFQQIDVARVRLIQQLRFEIQVNDEALPIVLSLLDQLYDQRRRLRELSELLVRTAPRDLRHLIARRLANRRDAGDLPQ